jgi:hypothetical protein
MDPITSKLLNIIANQVLGLVAKDIEIEQLKEEIQLMKGDIDLFEQEGRNRMADKVGLE